MFIIQMIERGYRHPDEMWYPRYLWIQSESYTNATVLLSARY